MLVNAVCMTICGKAKRPHPFDMAINPQRASSAYHVVSSQERTFLLASSKDGEPHVTSAVFTSCVSSAPRPETR